MKEKDVAVGKVAATLVLCLVVTVLLYLPRLRAPFLADDYIIFHSLENAGALGLFGAHPGMFFRPVISLHYYLPYLLWGLDPLRMHLVNLLWHLLCGVLLWHLSMQLLTSWQWPRERAQRASLIGTAMFLWLPANVEAVAWFASLADVFTTATMLAALLLLLQYLVRSCRLCYWLSLLCFAVGLFAKESLLTFPLVVLLWLHRKGLFSSFLLSLPFFVLEGVYWLIRTPITGGIGGYQGMWETLLRPWHILVHLGAYLFQMSMPTPLYGAGREIWDTVLWVLWGASIGLLLRGSIAKGIQPSLMDAKVILGSLFISLLPILIFKPSPYHFLNSRYTYMASAWFALWVGGLLAAQWQHHKIVRTGAIALLLLFAVGTGKRALDWSTAAQIGGESLTSIRTLPKEQTLLFISLPDHYRGAYIWRTGLKEAISLHFPERRNQPIAALSRFTMRLTPDTSVRYQDGTARLSNDDDIFLPAEHLKPEDPSLVSATSLRPSELAIDRQRVQNYTLVRFEAGRFVTISATPDRPKE